MHIRALFWFMVVGLLVCLFGCFPYLLCVGVIWLLLVVVSLGVLGLVWLVCCCGCLDGMVVLNWLFI